MPLPSRQTLPVGDRPFVDTATGRLTLSNYQFLGRLQAAVVTTARNIEAIADAVGAPVESIPGSSGGSVTIPASFPPPPDVTPALLDVVEDARLLAMLAAVPRPVAPSLRMLPPVPARPGDVVVLHHGARVMDGFGVPEGRLAGWVGDVFLQRDGGPAGAVWAKQSGAGTVAGWAVLGQGAGTGGAVLPLVNGNIAPVGMLSDPAGQTIGVPI